MEGNIGTRNTILNQLGNSWSMHWYLFTLETIWVINIGFFWMRDVAITSRSLNVLFTQENNTLTYHSKH